MHALNAPAWSLKRAPLFFKVSSFALHPAQQGMPIMSPVMAKALVDVSAEMIVKSLISGMIVVVIGLFDSALAGPYFNP